MATSDSLNEIESMLAVYNGRAQEYDDVNGVARSRVEDPEYLASLSFRTLICLSDVATEVELFQSATRATFIAFGFAIFVQILSIMALAVYVGR